jgi:type I restriction-modification system DNA methylase subunit
LPLFQKSILNSLKQDESLIALRWANYQNYLSKIDFIKTVKEEKYQDGFLKDIFEACLGYTLDSTNPSNFNLEREKKNETDGKKADGVIYVNNEIIGIVELKDQKTKNLDAVESQAFNYHVSHSNSKYIIISNFDELRFYIDKKTAYEKFNLFNLSYEDFRTLHLLLSFESISDNIPLKLKEKSASFEQTISKELYHYFSAFRTHLFENIVKNNWIPCQARYDESGDSPVIPCHDTESTNSESITKQTLLRLTQKLCDRIIFILFAEDRELLKKETIKEIRTRHANDGFGDRSMYDYYKLYFNAINTGNDKLGIPKYNGGLFATDELLDTLIIDDAYLDMEAQKLSDFDFVSDISVNILGHIFEQSLTDLEEMEKSFSHPEPSRHTVLDTVSNGFRVGARNDKVVSKRKKDGVFYTPEYITRYIVENTLGKLCSDKKTELKIEAETVVVNPRKLTKSEQSYKETLIAYREWLTHLKILDPACGSGAFLNQALEFLIREHTLIRDLLLPYEDLMIGYEIEKSILEHNLYGVDINEDAVEIAKLSLWLRTAHKGRELTSLNDKIVCANSLLAMPFEENSFDVVIGNPPYVRNTALSQNEKEQYESSYFVAYKQYDLYILFNELALKYTKVDGLIGYIQPNKFLSADYGIKTVNLIVRNAEICLINDVSLEDTFLDASVYPYIFIFKKKSFEKNIEIQNISIFDVCDKNNLVGFENQVKSITIIENIDKKSKKLSDLCTAIKRGVPNDKLIFSDEGTYAAVASTDLVLPYSLNNVSYKIDYKDSNYAESKSQEFSKPLILLPRTILKIRAIFSDNQTHILDRIYYLLLKDNIDLDIKTILLFLNSKLVTFYYDYFYGSTKIGGGYIDLKGTQIGNFPIFEKLEDQLPFMQKADLMLDLTKQLQTAKHNFLNELHLEKITQKLQKFEELEFDEFVKEYTKAKKLKFADKLEERNFKNDWLALFESDKKAVLELKAEIAKTDKEIDVMVYALYGLSEDEIAIVEGRG